MAITNIITAQSMKLKAFTLVELMVVMAIIAFLSVGAYTGLTFALRQGRDTQRMATVDKIQTALTAYYADYSTYPGCGWNGTAFVAGTGSLGITSLSNLTYCPSAFVKDDTTNLVQTKGKGGLGDYIEGDFSWGTLASDAANSPGDIRYYVMPKSDKSAQSWAVCVALENSAAGNTYHKWTSGDTNTTERGCYCVGTNTNSIACNGLTPKF